MSITKEITFTKISIINTGGTDKIILQTNLPSPFSMEFDDSDLSMEFDTTNGKGIEFVKSHFGIFPNLIVGNRLNESFSWENNKIKICGVEYPCTEDEIRDIWEKRISLKYFLLNHD